MTQVDDTIEMKQMVKSTPCYLYRFVACQLPKTPRLLRSLCGQVSYVLCQPIQLCGRRDRSWPQMDDIMEDTENMEDMEDIMEDILIVGSLRISKSKMDNQSHIMAYWDVSNN